MEKSSEVKASGREKFVKNIKASLPQIIGIVIVATMGLLYNRLVGCPTGSCPIVSNPWSSTIVGGFVGYIAGSLFSMRGAK